MLKIRIQEINKKIATDEIGSAWNINSASLSYMRRKISVFKK